MVFPICRSPSFLFRRGRRSTPSAAPPSKGGSISVGAGGSSGDISDGSSGGSGGGGGGGGGVGGALTKLGPGCRPHAELLGLKRLLLLLLILLLLLLLLLMLLMLLMLMLQVLLGSEERRACVRVCLTWGGGGPLNNYQLLSPASFWHGPGLG